jgi:hypothetical protein
VSSHPLLPLFTSEDVILADHSTEAMVVGLPGVQSFHLMEPGAILRALVLDLVPLFVTKAVVESDVVSSGHLIVLLGSR